MNKYVVLKKSDFSQFIKELRRTAPVMAPVAKGYNNYAFAEVKSGKEIALKYIPTILPPKKFFIPPHEKIQEFNKNQKKWTPVVKSEELILFGVHTCDLAGIQFLNKAMSTDPKDVNYLARKNKIAVIGLECNDYCDEFASCALMRNHLPKGGYDLFLTDLGTFFMVHVRTNKGAALVQKMKLPAAKEKDKVVLKALRKKKAVLFKSEVRVSRNELKKVFDKTLDSEVWGDLNRRCLSCGNCTNVCPTCYCFDIRDELALDLNSGSRIRVWDGCQSENFAKVAGGENFREERSERQRHRYFRKFRFPVSRFDSYACTGCGRCSRTCMAKINLKETINALAEEAK